MRRAPTSVPAGLFAVVVPLFSVIVPFVAPPVSARGSDGSAERGAKIGTARDFTLTAQDGAAFSTADPRGMMAEDADR